MDDTVMTDSPTESANASATPAGGVIGAGVNIDDVKKMSLGDSDKNVNDPDSNEKDKNDDDDCSEGTSTILGSEDDFEDLDDDNDNDNGEDNNVDKPEGKSQKKESKKSTDSSSKTTTAVEDAEEALIKAVSHKEEGNTYFKINDYEKAAASYRRGVNLIKKLNHNNTGNEQIKSLLVQLQTNFSIVRYKQTKYKVSIDLATKALLIDKNYVKALYWRALAYRKVAEYEQAKIDLRAAIVVEPNNSACKKELQQIKKDMETMKETQKKALAKAFSNKNNTSFLYNDKVEEEKRKELLVLEKQKYEQEQYKKRKSAWEDECVKRMTQNEKVESFEEYEKRLKDIEETKQKDEEKKQKAAKKVANQQRKKNINNTKNSTINPNDNDDDDDVLTEKELASMRGYKKTADGRTTSYFTRENVSDDLKKSLVAPPQRLDSISSDMIDSSPSSVIPRQQSIQLSQSQTSTSTTSGHQSVWNQAQTWEEKDTTEWCKKKLKEHLLNCTVTNVQSTILNCSITSVEEITGDASVAVVAGGKKRYIYDFHCKLIYEIQLSNSTSNDSNTNTTIVAKGIVKLPDICTGNDDIEVSYSSKWKQAPTPSTLHDPCMIVRTQLAVQLRTHVQCWIHDFNNQY